MITINEEFRQFKQDGTARVKLLVVKNRVKRRIETGLTVTRDDFTKSGKLRNQNIIQQIEELKSRFRKKLNSISVQSEMMTIDEVIDFLTRKEGNQELDFMELWREFIQESKAKGIKNYKTAYNSLCGYVGRDRLWVKEITYSFLDGYMKHLGEGRKVSLYLGAFRHVYSWAKLKYNDEERGIIRIPYSPFERFRVPKQQPSEKRALDVETIRKIIALPYDVNVRGKDKENRFNLAKDVFILSFALAGMNSADLYDCKEIEGKTIHYHRMKTRDRRSDGAEMKIEIPEQVMGIYEKYRDKTKKRVFRFYMMYGSMEDFNRALNLGLKKIGEEIGVKDLDFYAARHSWATIARNDLRIDKYVVNDALVHVDKSMAVTDIYIKKDFSEIIEANNMTVDFVFNK